MKRIFQSALLVAAAACIAPNTANAQFGKYLKKAKKIGNDLKGKTVKPTRSNTNNSNRVAPKRTIQTAPKRTTVKSTQSKTNDSYKQYLDRRYNNLNYIKNPGLYQQFKDRSQLYLNHYEYFYEDYQTGSIESDVTMQSFALSEVFGVLRCKIPSNAKTLLYLDKVHVPYLKKNKDLTDRINDPRVAENMYKEIDQWYTRAEKFVYRGLEHGKIVDRDLPYYLRGAYRLEMYADVLDHVVQTFIPENQTYQAVVKYAKKRANSLAKKNNKRVAKVSGGNSVHANNLYKILFTSNKHINPSTAPASAYKTTFKPGEEIWGVVFIDKPISQKIVESSFSKYSIWVPNTGSRYHGHYLETNQLKTKRNSTVYIFPIVVKPQNYICDDREAGGIELSYRWLAQKGPRAHKFVIELSDGNSYTTKPVDLKGELTIDASDSDMEIFSKYAKQIVNKCPR